MKANTVVVTSEQPGEVNQFTSETKKVMRVDGVDDADLANGFNLFFSRFEKSNFVNDTSKLQESVSQND